jgi:hypothetical protein
VIAKVGSMDVIEDDAAAVDADDGGGVVPGINIFCVLVPFFFNESIPLGLFICSDAVMIAAAATADIGGNLDALVEGLAVADIGCTGPGILAGIAACT